MSWPPGRKLAGSHLKIRGVPIADPPTGRKAYAPILAAGGYPEAVRRQPHRRVRFFEGYLDTIMQRDLRSIATLADGANARRPLHALAAISAREINAYERRMGWRFPWVSSFGSDFNYAFGVSFTAEQQANGGECYSTYGRGTDVFNTFYQLLDRAPKGRDALPRGEREWWWRRHDEYEDREA